MVETADIEWTPEGAPRSRRFQDIYFSREGGLEESRAVFLQGCGLPQAWRGRRRFVVGELGFGSGLNVLALLELWARTRPSHGRLHVFSVEAYPLAREAAARALGAWPEVAALAQPLLAAWPEAPGFHRIDLPGLSAVIDVAVAEAAEALAAWQGRADAWFLDGFSPARNPQMWREEVLELLARRSATGARAASFTVASAVRRGLEAQGFEVAKRPGFGAKSERLEARLPGPSTAESAPPRVCVIGAGIAGAALARAFLAEDLAVTVLERAGPAAAASGNPAALVTPRLDAGGGSVARLHAQAFRRSGALIRRETPAAVIAEGALQLEAAERDARRFDALAAGDVYGPGALVRVSAAEAGERLGEPSPAGGLWMAQALVVEPAALIEHWLRRAALVRGAAAGVQRNGPIWRVLDQEGRPLAEAEVVCVAAGHGSAALAPELRLEPVRGQASLAPWTEAVTPAAWGGYVVPTRSGLLFGATHDRGDEGEELRPADHARNLDLLARRRPELAAALAGRPLAGRAGVRASTPDRSPLAGPIGARPGLLVLTGLGGRGFVLAPLLAEHLAATAAAAPSPLPADLAALVAPDRFGQSSSRPQGR
jgi:tRNA 5-methylaminomethyl-2-thiouridine biosynthesis bifunctional protein